MKRRWMLLAVTVLLLPALSGRAAEDQKTPSAGKSAFGDIIARANGQPVLLSETAGYSEFATRFGWWGFWNNGSPAKTGEYQDLKPSPFWDVDGLRSDGTRTLEITATGIDQETTLGSLYFYRPDLTATADYERFLHRRDHDPLGNIPDADSFVGNPHDPLVIKEDLNVGEDYAVRVQQLNASIKWLASDWLKARVDIWGLRKEGTRQANAVAMSYVSSDAPPQTPDGRPLTQYLGDRLHMLSQSQHIDWLTQEIKPVIEAHLLGDYLVIEYSRPMRCFTAGDQTAVRYYDHDTFPLEGGRFPIHGAPYVTASYGVVPDSYTDMDQLKISGRLGENTSAYAYLMAGRTINQEIDMHRWFNDADLRLTNTSINNLTLTGYGKIFNEAEQMPDAAVVQALNHPAPDIYPYPTVASIEDVLVHPLDYHKTTAGLKGVWRVRGGGFARGGLAVAGGYEYCDLNRKNAIYDLETGGVIDESHTITNSFQVGPDMRWSDRFDTFLRYKFQNARQPLLGVQEPNGLTNTLLPQQDHIVELGFNWVPSDWFVFYACVGIERGDTHGTFGDSTRPINFDEENYPMSFSAWYAVSQRLSLSAGYAVYSNFVAQDVTVADQLSYPTGPGSVAPVTGRWNYGGQAHVVTVGSRYAATDYVILTGRVEWVRGHDQITNSTLLFPSGITVTDLGGYCEVLNETTRVTLGVDWTISPRIVNYYRYELYNFLDKAPGYQTGLAQGVLGGLSAIF